MGQPIGSTGGFRIGVPLVGGGGGGGGAGHGVGAGQLEVGEGGQLGTTAEALGAASVAVVIVNAQWS